MTENKLRLALLIIGLLILAGIYLYSRWRAQKQVNDIFSDSHRDQPDVLLEGEGDGKKRDLDPPFTEADRTEPELKIPETEQTVLIDEPVAAGSTEQQASFTLESENSQSVEKEIKPEPVPEPRTELPKKLKLVVMHLVAKQGKKFEGAAVLKALQAHKLRFGNMEIFHRITKINEKDQSVFSVANMVKPGTLIPDELGDLKLPGVSFFLSLPAPIDSLKAYDDMLHCVQHMATTLDGDIKDEEFMTLSREKIALQRAQLF